MFNRFVKSIVFLLCLLSTVTQAGDTPLYQEYQAFEDPQGNIYLQLPKQFVLIHADISIPLSVYPNNALVRLYEENGVWKVEILTEAQFNALTLTPSDYNIEYHDFSGDGDLEVVLRSQNIQNDSFILYGLENGSISFSVHGVNRDGVDLSKGSGAQFIDVNGDGYKDIQYPNYTLLGDIHKKFFNASRYKTSQAEIIGATGGSFRVAEDGSASYQIPLKLPQGIAGVAPQMAFSYSSNGGNSNLGRGWSLSGLTSISRCPKNYAQDGYIAGVNLSIVDEYCYNGQRLIKVSGTHGQTNAVYHTEFADFSVITITSSNTQGATGFEVETKSGETHYFGTNTVNANAAAYVGSISSPSAYLIAAIQDIKANQISYNYSHANALDVSDTEVDEVNLDTITWGATAAPNELKVNYIPNPRPHYGYRYGRQFAQTKYINNVELTQSGTLIRRYNITWDNGIVDEDVTPTEENISRVTDIQECLVENTTEQCLTASSFNWSSTQTGTREKQVCEAWFDEDIDNTSYYGKPKGHQICKKWKTIIQTANFEPFGDVKNISFDSDFRNSETNLTADANGDGLSDIYYVDDGKWAIAIMSATGEGDNRIIYKTSDSHRSTFSKGSSDYARVVDIDGDGRMEVIYPHDKKWYKLALSADNKLTNTYINSYRDDDHKNTLLLDVDGNGFIDMVTKKETGLLVYYNFGGYISPFYKKLITNSMVTNNLGGNASKVHLQTPALKNAAFLDLNGDGISDLISKGSVSKYYCEKLIGTAPTPKISNVGHWEIVYHSYVRSETKAYCDPLIAKNEQTYRNRSTSLTIPVALMGTVNSSGTPNYESAYPLNFLAFVDVEEDIRIADFNGDGLSDVLYRVNSKWHVGISKGDGKFITNAIPTNVLNASDADIYGYHRFADINGDGLTDLLAYKGSYFAVYLAQANKNNIPIFTQRLTISVDVDDKKQMHFADFDGDSQLDILFEQGSQMKYKLAKIPQQRKNVIDVVTSGFGQTTEIHYGLLQEDNNRIQTGSTYLDSLINIRRDAASKYYATYFKSDFVQPNLGLWVVSNVTNIGYDSYGIYQDELSRNKPVSISYQYSGMLMHRFGRGSLGFEQLATIDNTTGIKTTTKYSQAFPYVGMPISTTQSYDGKVLSESTNTFAPTWSPKFGLFPYIDIATDKKWRLLTNNTVAFSSHSQLDSNYDIFGNLTGSTSKQFANAGGTVELARVTTSNTYNGLGGGAEKGRLDTSSVTHTRGSESKTRSSSFGYQANGMLAWSKIDGLKQKTTYKYNAFGSKEKVCVIDENTSESRCSTTLWSSDGRFVTGVENAIAQSERYLYNGQAGSVNGRIWSKTTTGPNQIATTQYFDIQGQLVKEQRADGTTSLITRAYSSSTNLGNCIVNTQKLCFSETTTSSGKPSSTVWYDAYGRKVKAQTQSFSGNQWSSQYYTFDALARGKTTSEAYFESRLNGLAPTTALDKTTFYYDVLGRVTEEKLPDGAINKRRYNALENKYTDGEQNTRTETLNALGQLTKVTTPVHTTITQETGGDETMLQAKDAFKGMFSALYVPTEPTPPTTPPTTITTFVRSITDYQYDVFGKLTKVSNYASNNTSQKVTIHTQYDNEGRKNSMYDPDKGYWQYAYNAFGELTAQTSANNLTSRNYYDVLGRKTKSTEQALGGYNATVSCFHYGTSTADKNVGKLIKQQQFTSSNSALSGFNCASKINTTATWQQSVNFDQLGRLSGTTTTFEGKSFLQSQTYDAYSRVSTQTLPKGLVVNTQYQYGYLKRIKQGNLTLREITEMDAAGRIKKETIGKGIRKTNGYDEIGRVSNISLTKSGGQILHNLSYDYDYVGNLTERNQNYAGSINFSENFEYDSINRVKERSIDYSNIDVSQLDEAFAYQQNYEYDFIGNITRKYSSELVRFGEIIDPRPPVFTPGSHWPISGGEREEVNHANNYTYNYQWQTHSDSTGAYPLKRRGLHNIQKGSNTSYRNYSYDANGNVTSDGSRDYDYTPFDKPWQITSGVQSSKFKYANRSRYLREDKIQEKNPSGINYSGLTQYKTHYVGAYERIERTGGAGSKIEHKYQIAGAVLTRKEGETTFSTLFAHTDYQGSAITITDENGQMAEQFIYDPWGKKTKVIINNNVGSLVGNLTRGSATTRGYTGHEGIDHFDLIHMNGRVYDAEIGRFLQADPNIQAPTNSQNYNRYSYVLNNPMSYTDPSGYFFKKIFKAIAKVKWLSAVISVAMTIFIPGCQTGMCAAAFNSAMTYSLTGSLKNAAIGFAVAMIMPGGDSWGAIAGSAVIGGISSKLQGGNFGHGFFSAGIGAKMGGGTGKGWAKVLSAAVVGGTLSKITGGKFANGAFSAAFIAAMKTDFGGSKNEQSSDVPIPAKTSKKLQADINKKIEALNTDIEKINKNGGFATEEAAAEWYHKNIHPLGMKHDTEFGAKIFKNSIWNGKASVDKIFMGSVVTQHFSNQVDLSDSTYGSLNAVAKWHSHGNDNVGHTIGADTDWADASPSRSAYVSRGPTYSGQGVSLDVWHSGSGTAIQICEVTCNF
ncbi:MULTISPECIES: FG-GAP-like repeat-containing protein [unclassified Colwellia]|uniref:FG-GAP-like repeat-containing protein n=1 Tax=unclassified Colwellia TaxID=196834 RepID=UPI0015F76A99|nr:MULTISPECIES: FG-GAP-like repeat-containing protein [unclassified Colwellia]MBA6233648.1 VCBS repeat-containing protein [Colwellia sp. MB02u-7]MBA6237290.1 VCBS repeat-containing protein [Colwellia sp. MB02u-11]MBA6300535.1 VCBS repeat-containing protein [Colwellia sp. MB3u-22]MBA6311126.1 VCBS repeat-containing protein [Colwellia sp. MB3u-64]